MFGIVLYRSITLLIRELLSTVFMILNNRVKKGGPNPTSNSVLAAVLEKVKELDVPKDIVERNIKKASEKGQEAYVEKIYEVLQTIHALILEVLGVCIW